MAKEKEEVISQDFEAQIPEEEEGFNLWQRFKTEIRKVSTKGGPAFGWNRKYVFVGVGIFIFLILILLIARSSLRISRFKPPVFPSPSPSPYEEEITNPSVYATDSAVLEIDKRLKEIEKDIDQTDLKETGLNPPVLDMNVNFEE